MMANYFQQLQNESTEVKTAAPSMAPSSAPSQPQWGKPKRFWKLLPGWLQANQRPPHASIIRARCKGYSLLYCILRTPYSFVLPVALHFSTVGPYSAEPLYLAHGIILGI